MLHCFHTKLITPSTYFKISLFGNISFATVIVGAWLSFTHPQSPSCMAQQQAITPAQPMPPQQCMRIGTPLRAYWFIRLIRCTSRCAGARGTKPLGIGRLWEINRELYAAEWYTLKNVKACARSTILILRPWSTKKFKFIVVQAAVVQWERLEPGSCKNEITPNYAACTHVFYSSHIGLEVLQNSAPWLIEATEDMRSSKVGI